MILLSGESTLFLVMAWFGQATNHYLGQSWPQQAITWAKVDRNKPLPGPKLTATSHYLGQSWPQQAITWAKVDPDICHHMASLCHNEWTRNYNGVIMSPMASQITSLTIVYSAVYSGTYQRKHQSSASLAFVRRIYRWPVNSRHKGPVTRKMFPFDDVIMIEHWTRFGSL